MIYAHEKFMRVYTLRLHTTTTPTNELEPNSLNVELYNNTYEQCEHQFVKLAIYLEKIYNYRPWIWSE